MEQTKRKPKIFRAKHDRPGDFQLNYILLPIGYSYNAEWLEAKKGDILRLWDGSEYRIFSVRKLDLRKAINADILCRMRYGITIKRALQIWQRNAKLEGHGAKAVSIDECLWIIYEQDEQDSL